MSAKKNKSDPNLNKRKSSEMEKSSDNNEKLTMIDITESKRLSKNILAMKFMQRKAEAELRERLRKEQEEAIIKARWSTENEIDNLNFNELSLGKKLIWEEVSIINMLKNPVPRRSFGGFNPIFETKTTLPPSKKQKIA